MKTSKTLTLVPLMLCFFVMGFVDLVGIASNYVKEDMQLSDTMANLMPSLVFFWFFVCSVPTGMLMNRIGRKRTVLLSLGLTLPALALPLISASFPVMLLSFSLLGIGNAVIQTSLNPLVSAVTQGKNLAATLTFGQFVKAIASFIAPYLAMWGATKLIPDFGLDWRILFLIFLIIGVISTLWLVMTHIEEEPVGQQTSTFGQCLHLLSVPVVLLSFLAIVSHVGIDVGINATTPKILIERLGITLNEAAFAVSLYFISRTAGCLLGSFLLRIVSGRTFFAVSITLLAFGTVGLAFGTTVPVLYASIILAGLGNSNVFPLIFSQAMMAVPQKQNEVSGLMIMGLIGGTIFPFFMGMASDALGQIGAVGIMALGVVYLLFYACKMKK